MRRPRLWVLLVPCWPLTAGQRQPLRRARRPLQLHRLGVHVQQPGTMGVHTEALPGGAADGRRSMLVDRQLRVQRHLLFVRRHDVVLLVAAATNRQRPNDRAETSSLLAL